MGWHEGGYHTSKIALYIQLPFSAIVSLTLGPTAPQVQESMAIFT